MLQKLFFSNKDKKFISQVFRREKWKKRSKLFDLEKEEDFRLFIPQRDIAPGLERRNEILGPIQSSRRVIFIVSR